jgi:hypothetical protein
MHNLVLLVKTFNESSSSGSSLYPSYSGSKDQEDQVLANSSPDPTLKKPITKKGMAE